MVVKIFQLCKVVLLVVCREATSHDNAAIWWTVIMLGQAGTSGEPKMRGVPTGIQKWEIQTFPCYLLAKVWISDCHVGYKLLKGWDWDSDSCAYSFCCLKIAHHEVDNKQLQSTFRILKIRFEDKTSGDPPKKQASKNVRLRHSMWVWKLVSTSIPPWVWLGKGLFLPSWCHCSTWSNFLEQDHHSEDWNWEHSNFGVAKTLWQFDLWRQPYCMIVWVSTLFIFMKGTLLTCTDAEAVFRRPNWNIFSARKYSGYTSPAPFKDLDRIALTGSASKPWLRLL